MGARGKCGLLLLAALACRDGQGTSALPPPAAVAAPAAAPELAGYRVAYDLVANRVHALVYQGGRLAIPAGGPELLKFVDGSWKSSWIVGGRENDKQVAFVSGLSASFFVPVDADGDGIGAAPPAHVEPSEGSTPPAKEAAGQGPSASTRADPTLRITMRAVTPGQRVSVFANEKPITTIEVAPSWGSYDVVVPAAALLMGENRFRLTFRSAGPVSGGKRSAAAIGRIEVGPAGAPGAEPPAVVDVDFGGQRRRAFASSGASRVSFYVQVPTAAKLALSHGSAAPGATALVRVARDGAAPTTLFEGQAAARWTDGAWDLAPWAGEAVRIDLVGRGGGVAWGAPRLLVRGAQGQTLPAPPRRSFERIFVWMVDTLRADKVRVYNPKTIVRTPSYDAFSADATRFAWAHVPGTWSLPSHASILTGVYPTVHKATAHEARLSRDVHFVAEMMKKAGYRTALFSSNGYVSGKWGFDRGWDVNRNFIRESLPNGADYLWKTAKTWMAAQAGKPQFLYLATVEPHVVYNPKKEFLDLYWKEPYKGPIRPSMTGIQLGQIKTGKLKIDERDKAYLEALHNAEITQSDAAFGAFVADLKAAGIYDSSVVIVVSDHGDEFWEHGDVGHAQSVHQELVHIPLVIRAPGVFPAGKVVEADVEAMDLFPTLLELAGLTVPPETQGSSLIALAHDEIGATPRVALSQNMATSRGIKVGRYRLIHAGAGRLELYDEIRDPLETENLADRRPIALRQMRNVLGLLLAFESRWKKWQWGTAANLTEGFYSGASFAPQP